jgi:hypothetical protein
MAGKFFRGALVEFTEAFTVPLPNVIVFQYNPETITHTWNQPAGDPSSRSNPLAVRGLPGESFSFTIAMDAGDMIADGGPAAQVIATTSGIYARLAALEMLQYPVSTSGAGDLIGSVSAAITSGIPPGGQVKRLVPEAQVPTVLFVWGPGRILPVRVTGLTITERLYDPFLNPTHAEAQLNLRVLTPEELISVSGLLAKVAKTAYIYSQRQRQVLALANLGEAAESIIGMLPLSL